MTSAVDEAYDPFEAFDRAMGAETVRNPYPDFAALRRQGPVHPFDLRDLGAEVDISDALPDIPTFTVLSYDGVMQVLRDGTTFSSSAYTVSMGTVMGRSILMMDEPEHHRYRALIQQAFTRKAMEHWETDIVRPVVNRFIDEFADAGSADLVRQLTFPFPVHVIAGMLGLPEEDLRAFHGEAAAMINVGSDWDRGLQASQWLRDYFAGILEQRRSSPGPDLITVLAEAELDGDRLTDDDIFAFLRLLLPAGAETTYRSSSNLLFGLLTHPAMLDAVRDDRSLIPQAIEEGLRWEPPLTSIARLAVVDVDVCGYPIPAGSVVLVNMGSANHDETKWERPDEFDIFRPGLQHMAFAFGPHMCLGMHLARMETTVMLNAVLDRLPDVRLDPAAEDVHITGLGFRAPRSLPVVWGWRPK